MSIGGGDKNTGRKNFESGITAIHRLRVMHQPDPVLAGSARNDVIVRANPSYPIAERRASLSGIAKRDEQSSVRCVFGDMSIAGQRQRELAGCTPGFSLVVRENDKGMELPAVFAE